MTTDKNPPAFPYAFQHKDDSPYCAQGFSPGMRLRDWLAGQALCGFCGVTQERVVSKGGSGSSENETQNIAVRAYAIADAMLEVRNRSAQ